MRLTIPAVLVDVGGSTFSVPYLRLLRDLAHLPWGVLRARVLHPTLMGGAFTIVDPEPERWQEKPLTIFFGPQLPGWARWMAKCRPR